ncbi:YkgJ family cysteine cluster protein [Desulfopila sp. IMCC35008]|uniref:YkgJ family cysteine cluster protein n=1 Tax=Desulfopila sp. IMCC35008 TaxID=2653858 RepID=UPI0013D7A2FA|nr:YkgJ family cysteine cluster protein [Desulfopila sp. IMCC35008]
MTIQEKNFPEGMVPLGTEPFSFKCHPGVSCFTVCCRKVDLILYPYDVIRLKNNLNLSSGDFLNRYARPVQGQNPYFPTLMLRLNDEGTGSCPFLTEQGCSVYDDRPTDCRTYPLERAVDRNPDNRKKNDYYFIVHHDYCKGHKESEEFTVKQWIRNQRLDVYNTYNELWTDMDTFFQSNPWKGEGVGGPGQQVAFMVCYNIDMFRGFCGEHKILERFKITRDRRRGIEKDDFELLKFGFDWLKHINGVQSGLVQK